MNEKETICPNCETREGKVGSPCRQPICEKKGYHFIPLASFNRYQEWLSQPGASEDPEIGRVVDRYLVADKLGAGGMGSVYLALQMPLMREVALKMVSGVVLDDVARQRFEREAKSISILYHPNIVGLIDYGFNPATGAPFMAIEYVKGGRELASEMVQREKRSETWPYETIINIFSQILNGLSIAHKSGLIHRDIKPQNIMLLSIEGNPHFVKLLDFGLARALVEIPGGSKLTMQGAIMGTPQYMAPEQICGREGAIDHRCDLYAVGAILFEMVTSRLVYPGESPRDIFAQKMNPDFDPMKSLPPGAVHPEIKAFLKKALDRDPTGRFLNAGEMKNGLVRTFSVAGDLSAKSMDDIGYAPTMEMELPPGFKKESFSQIETVAHDELSGKVLPAETRDTGSIETPKDKFLEKKKLSPAAVIFLIAGITAAAVILFFFILPYFDGLPGRAAANGSDEETAAAAGGSASGKKQKEAEKIIDTSTIPAGLLKKAGQEKMVKKKDADAIGVETAPEKGKEDAAAAAEVTDADVPVKDAAHHLPQKPPPGAVKKAMKKLRGRVKKCAEGFTEKVQVDIMIRFGGPSGSVKDMDGMILPLDKRDCIKKAVNETKIPPFRQESFSVPFSFTSSEKKPPGEGSPGEGGDESDLIIVPDELPDKVINTAIRKKKMRSWLIACANDKTGVVKVEVVVVGKTGTVKDARIIGGDFMGTQEGECMEKAIEKLLVFSPFLKEQVTFKRQFKIE